MAHKKITQLIVIIISIVIVFSLINYFASDVLSLQTVQQYHEPLKTLVENYFILSSILYIITFVGLTSASLPVLSLLLLLAGSLFPLAWGLCLAYISFFLHCFVMSAGIQYCFRDYFKTRYEAQLSKLNQSLETKGIYYVIFLRMSMLVPSQILNIAVGITNMNPLIFSAVSVISFLPVLSMLVYSGQLLVSIESIWDLYSHQNLLLLLGVATCSLIPLYLSKKTNH